MFVYLDVVCADHPVDPVPQPESAVRAIGEILPLVMAQYGISRREFVPEVRRESPVPANANDRLKSRPPDRYSHREHGGHREGLE
jgi:hypothetical protein